MDMQKIGAFLAELRKENKYTQDELGEKIGVTNKTVSRWENGNYLPPVEMLQILSKLYNVSINELLSGERLNEKQYKENAEEYIVADLMKKRKEAKKKNCGFFSSISHYNTCRRFDNSFKCFAFRAYLVKNYLHCFVGYSYNFRHRSLLCFDC